MRLCFWSFLWRITRGRCIRWIIVVACAKYLTCAVCVVAYSFSVEITTSCITRTSSKIVFFTIGNVQKQINASSYDDDSLTRKSVQKKCFTRSTMILLNSSMCTNENDVLQLYFQVRTNMTLHILTSSNDFFLRYRDANNKRKSAFWNFIVLDMTCKLNRIIDFATSFDIVCQ